MSNVFDIEEYFPGYEVTDKAIALIELLMKEAGLTPDDVRKLGPKKSAAALYRAQKKLLRRKST